ncbi:hypothetical protein [Kordia sp.]|uniref:hypothetical protein n=1 Tax=Kordia sp. TaxID=1965332 RepID=UPI003D29A1FB
MKSIENLRKEELSTEKLHRICGGESTESTTETTTTETTTSTTTTTNTTTSSNTKIVNVGNSIVDDLNGLIR